MLKIDRNPKFWNTVEVVLGDQPAETFKAQFKVRPTDVVDKLDLADLEAYAQFLDETVLAVEGVEVEDGPELTQPQLIDFLLTQPHIRVAIFRSYLAGVSGAKRGN